MLDRPPETRLRRLATLALATTLACLRPALAGNDWIPPSPVQLATPNATLAPGQLRTLEFLIRANGAPANLMWTVTTSGPSPNTFAPIVSPTMGTVSLAADQTVAITLNVTVPAAVTSPSIGSVYVDVDYDPGPGQACPQARIIIRAATGGRPEIYPLPSIWQSGAGTNGSVTYELRSMTGGSEQFALTLTRTNPDANNPGMLFPGSLPSSPVTLPGGGTALTTAPTTVPFNTYAGNLNQVKIQATSESDPMKGLSDATGAAFVSAPVLDSLPQGLKPVGLVLQEEPVTGRDGPVFLPGRGLYAVPSGGFGVRVLRDSSLNQVGPLDLDANALDDRLVGRIRFPAYVASMTVVTGFVTSVLDVLDLGLVACGPDGLMLVDMRDIIDPPAGTWEDFYDLDGNGIDDRILRMLPIQGFATDVEWFKTPEGRTVALVAAADFGSNPVATSYNPFLIVPGTGAGVVAIDVDAAFDSLPGVPFMAGTLSTPGTTLDLALRGGPAPDLAVADGADSVTFWTVTATGVPATTGFTRQDGIALSSAWGTRYARDLDWVATTPDSTYLAVASGPAGVQIVKAPRGGTPYLAIAQRTESGAIGIASTANGNVAAALGAQGATLLKLPWNHELDQIGPAAIAPYTSPVILDTGAPWPYVQPLRLGTHGTTASAITALRFAPVGVGIPDLLCADGARTLILKPGYQGVVGVPEADAAGWTPGLSLRIAPNPTRGDAEFRVLLDRALGFATPTRDPVWFEVIDLQGRVVRRLGAEKPTGATSGLLARARFDGRDGAGHALGSGRYWVRASQRSGWSARAGFVLLH